MEQKELLSENNDSDILVLPLKIKSANEILRQHWATRRKSKQEYKLFIRNQMRLKNIQKAECRKYNIKILSYRKRLLDYDNLVSGCKSLLDAMIDEGLIYDDSPDYIEAQYKQYKSKELHTIIIRSKVK